MADVPGLPTRAAAAAESVYRCRYRRRTRRRGGETRHMPPATHLFRHVAACTAKMLPSAVIEERARQMRQRV